jgi:hypothetical protein
MSEAWKIVLSLRPTELNQRRVYQSPPPAWHCMSCPSCRRDNPCAICVFGVVGGWGDRLLVGVVPELPHQRTPHDLELERVHRRLIYEVPARSQRFPPEIRLEAEFMRSEKDAKLAQKLAQLQPFLAVFPHECMGKQASFGPI